MPSTLANLIKHNALLQADAFIVRNRMLEWRATPGQTLFHAAAWLVLILVVLGFALRTAGHLPLTSIATVLQWPRAVLSLTTVAGACFGVAMQRNARAAFARSWLAVAPLSRPRLALAHGVRLTARLLVALGAGLLLAYLLLFDRTEVEVGPLLELQAQVSLFFLAAAVLGNLASARHDAKPRRKPRLQPRPQTVHRQRVSVADLRPLRFWVFAVWRENLRGTYLAWPLLLILLLVPIGSPLRTVLLGLICWLGVLAAIALTRAQAEVIACAATWLRSTPLPFSHFAAALCLRPALAFALVAAASVLLLVMLGVSIAMALPLWLAALLLYANAVGVALQCRYAPSRRHLRLVIDALLLALFAQLALPLAYPLGLLLVLRHWRRAAVLT